MEHLTIRQLANRLNEIMIEQNKISMKSESLSKEYDEIVYELWKRLPHLKDDPNIQPKRKVRKQ